MPVATKEFPAPLDAFETAKPDEPIWTVQGGDPLGPPLLRLWSLMARIRAGAVSTKLIAQWVQGVQEVAESHSVADDERESQNLLVRATATEEISWRMDEYARGQHNHPVDQPTQAADTHLDELQRIDLHDLRVRAASKINGMVSELIEIDKALIERNFTDARCYKILAVVEDLKNLSHTIEPRRMMKRTLTHG